MTDKDKNVDGLRGLAALSVAITHFIGLFTPDYMSVFYPGHKNFHVSPAYDFFTFPLISILYNGQLAVLIFFVLSGYVLTKPHFKNRDDDVLKKRAWARYLRLNIPIAVAVLISYLIYKAGFYENSKVTDLVSFGKWSSIYFKDGLTFEMALQEALFKGIFFGSNSFIPPLWTLKVEFIGSIILLLFFIAKPSKHMNLSLFIICVGLIIASEKLVVYFLSMFFGAIINTLKPTKFWIYTSFLLGLLFGSFQLNNQFYLLLPSVSINNSSIEFDMLIYNFVGASLLTLAVINDVGKKILQTSIMQFLGKISFSLYLLHFSILYSLSCALYIYLPRNNASLIFIFLVYIGECLFLSKLFQMYVDQPAINLSKKFASQLFLRRQQ